MPIQRKESGRELKLLSAVILFVAFLWGQIPLALAQTAEVTREGEVWTSRVGTQVVYSGSNMTEAVNAACNRLGNGSGTINIRNSGVADVFWGMQARAGQTLDFHGNTVHSATNVIPIYGDRRSNITVRNLHMTGAPRYGIWYRGGSNIHLHNIRMELSPGALGLGIRVDHHSDHRVPTFNLRMTGEIYIEGASHHSFETYGIDGIEIDTIVTRNGVGSGVQLNDSRNVRIGTIDAYRTPITGGYGGLRVANGGGPNIHVERLFARDCGRGFFSLSGSRGTTIDYAEITGSSSVGIWIQETPDTRVLSGYVWENASQMWISGVGSFANVHQSPPPHEITLQPQSQAVSSGDDAVFAVSTVQPTSLNFEWYYTNNPSVSASDTRVGAGSTLTVSDVGGADVGYYYCRIENPALGVVGYSAVAELILRPPPGLGEDVFTWTGAYSEQWDENSPNWITTQGPTSFGPGGVRVRFDDSGPAGDVILVGSLTPSEVLVETNQTYGFLGTGSIEGDTALFKAGSGTLRIHGGNTYSGGTVIAGGTLAVGSGTADVTWFGNGPITLRGGTLAMWDDRQIYNTQTYQLVVPAGEEGALHADSRSRIYGTLTGGGTLRVQIPWIRTDFFGDWSAFVGQIEVHPGPGGRGGEFRMARNYDYPGFPHAAVYLASGARLQYTGILSAGAGSTVPIGELSGESGSVLLGGPTDSGARSLTYRVGGQNTDALFVGHIRETNPDVTNLSIVKTGTGTWTLQGENAWNGSTTVEQGRLVVSGAVASGRHFIIAEGAEVVLTGNGSINGGDSFTNNGLLRIYGEPDWGLAGAFVNNGVLDLIQSNWTPPAGFQNNGRILRLEDVRGNLERTTDDTLRMRFRGYPGHSYRLQRAQALSSGEWSDVPGAAWAPEAESEIVFEVPDSGQGKGFFRLVIEAETF